MLSDVKKEDVKKEDVKKEDVKKEDVKKEDVKNESGLSGQPASPNTALHHQGFINLETERASLCDLLDHILDKGALVAGELTISVADIDLLYLDLRLLLTSIATVRREAMRKQKWMRNEIE